MAFKKFLSNNKLLHIDFFSSKKKTFSFWQKLLSITYISLIGLITGFLAFEVSQFLFITVGLLKNILLETSTHYISYFIGLIVGIFAALKLKDSQESPEKKSINYPIFLMAIAVLFITGPELLSTSKSCCFCSQKEYERMVQHDYEMTKIKYLFKKEN